MDSASQYNTISSREFRQSGVTVISVIDDFQLFGWSGLQPLALLGRLKRSTCSVRSIFADTMHAHHRCNHETSHDVFSLSVCRFDPTFISSITIFLSQLMRSLVVNVCYKLQIFMLQHLSIYLLYPCVV